MPDIVLIPPGATTPLDPTSAAFAHGFGLFETMRYADGRLDFWRDHWARLSKSARHFSLALPAESAVRAALRELVVQSGFETATLKLSLLKETQGSRLYVYARPPIPAPDSRCLRLDTTCPIFPRSALAGHKTHNYMEAMHLLGLARADGYYDMLRLDADGFLAEATTANLFFVKDGRLHTPSLDGGILPGVTRAALLRTEALAVEEGRYPPGALLGAEAGCITNATHGVIPIERIEGIPPQQDGPQDADFQPDHPMLATVREAYARIRSERAEQLI